MDSREESKLNPENNNDNTEWIKPPATLKSSLWQHFKLARDRTKTKCNYCGAVLKHTNGCTTGMSRHMKAHHPKEELSSVSKAIERPIALQAPTKPQQTKQTSVLSQYFGAIKPGSARHSQITSAIMFHIVKDLW